MNGPFGGVKGPLKNGWTLLQTLHTKILCARLAAAGQPQKGAAARRSSSISHWPRRPCVSEGATRRRSGWLRAVEGHLTLPSLQQRSIPSTPVWRHRRLSCGRTSSVHSFLALAARGEPMHMRPAVGAGTLRTAIRPQPDCQGSRRPGPKIGQVHRA